MSNLAVFDLEQFGKIRISPKGEGSVFDLIQVVGGQKNPHQTWKNLSKQFPEVLQKAYYLQFPGAGQRETPVMDKEGLLELIGLLPGAVGNAYRQGAAKLVLGLLENPAELAKVSIDRIDDQKELEDVAAIAHRKYLEKYHPLMNELKNRGALGTTYQHVNFINTKTCLGKTPQLIKAERGGKTAREHATSSELIRLQMLQDLQHGGIVKKDAQGHAAMLQVASDAASKFGALIAEFSLP